MTDLINSKEVKTVITYIIQFNQDRYMMEVEIFKSIDHKEYALYDMDGNVTQVRELPKSLQSYVRSLVERSHE